MIIACALQKKKNKYEVDINPWHTETYQQKKDVVIVLYGFCF